MSHLHDRRSFLQVAAAGAVWAAADLSQVEAALAWAGVQKTKKEDAAFGALTPDQARAVDALTSRIIPAVDGRPGAHEAGVAFFVDKALATFNAGQKDLYVEGLRDLDRRAAVAASGAAIFAGLTPSQQDAILREVENTPFFQAVRFDTIVGMFALPTWSGNRNYAGWHMLGLEHEPQFQPPFGFYDADANQKL
jgi:gluconate 2-dehydrogenase gamma chain